MTLGSFTPKPQIAGDRFQPSLGKGRPLIVQVIGLDGAKAVSGMNGQGDSVKKALYLNVWDLVGGQVAKDEHDNVIMGAPNTVYCNVQWLAGAVVDNLEPYVGGPPMAVRLSSQRNKQGTFSYLTVAPCEGFELQQCNAVFEQDPTRFDREVQARAVAAAQQAAQPAYNQSGFQPMATPSPVAQQPAQPQYQQAPPQQFAPPAFPQPMQQAPAAAQFDPSQFQAPPGQQGAIAAAPAQIAQQWANVVPPAQQYAPQQPAPQAPPAQPQYQQQAPPVAQQFAAQPPAGQLQVNDSQVASILAGLTEQAVAAAQPPHQ